MQAVSPCSIVRHGSIHHKMTKFRIIIVQLILNTLILQTNNRPPAEQCDVIIYATLVFSSFLNFLLCMENQTLHTWCPTYKKHFDPIIQHQTPCKALWRHNLCRFCYFEFSQFPLVYEWPNPAHLIYNLIRTF